MVLVTTRVSRLHRLRLDQHAASLTRILAGGDDELSSPTRPFTTSTRFSASAPSSTGT